VQRDIRQSLGLGGDSCFVASFDRGNLYLAAQPRTNGARQLKAFLDAHSGRSGIIYCNTRRQVEILIRQLQMFGIRALPYHAGLGDEARRQNQRAFVRDEVSIIVATVAFGMGINKSNVRFVMHYDLPPSLENYYQEIGRSGRDGLPADCLLLYSRADMVVQMKHIEEGAEKERPGRTARLQAMMRYAQTPECRRKPILTYFGESYTTLNCGACDNCLYGSKLTDAVDVTEHAQRMLLCVQQTNQRFGISHVVQVLRGSQAQRLLQFHHDRLTTYGAGKALPERVWKSLAQQFVQQGLLEQEMEHGTLRVTDKGRKVLRGAETVRCVMEPDAKVADRRQSGVVDSNQNCDPALFDDLRNLRRALAERENVPPFMIFSDRTLLEMASLYPQTERMLLAVNGVGEYKVARFGQDVLHLIRRYCAEHNVGGIDNPLQNLSSMPVATARAVEVGDLLNSGASIPDLQKMYGVKLQTIINHLCSYLRAGGKVDPDAVLTMSQLTPEQRTGVLQAFAALGTNQLTPIFERLQGSVSYAELHLMRVVVLCGGASRVDPSDDTPA
jgi:ATP-dependent DNA helicase RecQ